MRRYFVPVVLSALLASACSQKEIDFSAPFFCWGDTEISYGREATLSYFDLDPEDAFIYSAWKGETVNAAAVICTPSGHVEKGVTVQAGPLRKGLRTIPADCVKAEFVGFVKGDELLEGYGQCGYRDTTVNKVMEAPDLIGFADKVDMEGLSQQMVWLSVKVPADAAPGRYRGSLILDSETMPAPKTLEYVLTVVDRVLPDPSEWTFHLDLWQNPYSVARVAGVPLWSEEHFQALKPVMSLLASAGQKVVTTTIMDRPWNGQTEDPFGPMVTKTRCTDGSWTYDYSIFDKWVEFMESVGIDSQINCYTMIPWDLTFDYVDQASGTVRHERMEPGSDEYAEYWGSFLKDFAAHLKARGWFEKTHIAMDERPEHSMRVAIDLIHAADPAFKIALAGTYMESVADEIDDLCIGFAYEYPDGAIERRRAEGKITTYYTCCAEKFPNTFMASPRAEAAWIPWVSLARGVDGYLRWAYNSWTARPETDSRFRTWSAGDCYMVYPGGKTGVRFEKLREGLQDYTKASILMDEWSADGSHEEELARLKEALTHFTFEEINENGASPSLKNARQAIDIR